MVIPLVDTGVKVKRKLPIEYEYQVGKTNFLGAHGGHGTPRVWNTDQSCFFAAHTPVKVYITSLLYLGQIDLPNGTTTKHPPDEDDYRDYFTIGARKQLGSHVFIDPWARINTLGTIIHIGAVPGVQAYECNKSANIHAIYPVARRYEQGTPGNIQVTHAMCLGLIYRHWNEWIVQNNQLVRDVTAFGVGDRQFSRLRKYTNPLSTGHVFEFEVHGPRDINRIKRIGRRYQGVRRVAFYVCAGAKLVVYDSYSPQATDTVHNRSLVQQGGIVVVQGCRFHLATNVVLDEPNQTRLLQYPPVQAQGREILVGNKDLIDILNPVIFLGPTESEYESIAWQLQIKRHEQNGQRVCVLRIPDGAHIVAIEDWKAGIAEITARYQYELLHQSVVATNAVVPGLHAGLNPGFVVPRAEMLRKILGLGHYANRHFQTNIRAVRPEIFAAVAPVPSQLPKQYNTYQFQASPTNQTQPYVPPLWPPIKIDGLWSFYPCIPHKKLIRKVDAKERNITDEFLYRLTDQDWLEKYDIGVKADKVNFTEFEWNKMAWGVNMSHCDGQDKRIGIDGWAYQKTVKEIGGKIGGPYYQLVQRAKNNPGQYVWQDV